MKNCPCCLKAYILVFIMWIKKSFYVSSEYRVVFLPPCYYCRTFEIRTFSYLFTNKLKHLATVCRYTRIIISISHWTPLLISFIDFFICHLFNTSFIQISLFLWKVCNDTWSTYLFTCTCTVYNSMVRIKWEQTNYFSKRLQYISVNTTDVMSHKSRMLINIGVILGVVKNRVSHIL